MMNQVINFCICIYLAALVFNSESAVKWTVMNKSIKIGDEAILSCNFNDFSPCYMEKTWFGGRIYDLLCYDDNSTNLSKYEMKSYDTSLDSSLIIKQFDFTDINCRYTCTCGFNMDTHVLKLDDFNFIYGDIKDSSKLETNRFHVEVEMKVYPIPNCSITYELKEYETSLSIAESVRSNGNGAEHYIVTIHANVVPSHSICVINLKCKVRSSSQSLYNILEINACKDVGSEHVSTAFPRLRLSVWMILIPITIRFL